MAYEYNTTWGEVINAVRPFVSEQELEAIIDIFGAWSEITSIYRQIETSHIFSGYLQMWTKGSYPNKSTDQAFLERMWKQEYQSTLVLLAVQVRIINKSLYTLRNKICILINTIDNLGKEDRNGNIQHYSTQAVLDDATAGKGLADGLMAAIDIPDHKNRRDNAEHNIDKDFQQQMKIILSEDDFRSKDNALKKTLIVDINNIATTRKKLEQVISIELFDYIRVTRTKPNSKIVS